jgi:hydrogenase expression/formation protein HypD
MGYAEYEPLACACQVPIVVTGFEPVDILSGILACVQQLETGRSEVENAYARGVCREGNVHAKRLMDQVFEVTDRSWRGLGRIPQSGLRLRREFQQFDAEARFGLNTDDGYEVTTCIGGSILQGHKRPPECPEFATICTPETPLGAPMVSAEGACAAYYRYRRTACAALGGGIRS